MNHKMTKKQVEVQGHKVMTYHFGEGEETLLLISGGPGCPSNAFHDTHDHYADYADHGLHVVTWDQLGCGESDHPEDAELWQIPRFVEEVEIIRQSLGLKKLHILGQSWGGVLGLEYCLAYPDAVKTFIITSSAFNIPLMQHGFERHKLALGHETVRMMARREANGTTDHPEYQAVFTLLAHRHLCRLDEWPDSLKASMNIAKPMLSTVFGNYLFNCTGLLRNYDRTNDLSKIKQPCLIIHGEYDYIITECATLSRDYLPNAELHILENCSHATCVENPKQYHQILGNFLSKHVANYNCSPVIAGNAAIKHSMELDG
jgi:proline iminopeptidase